MECYKTAMGKSFHGDANKHVIRNLLRVLANQNGIGCFDNS
jgi:hypothetical protein